MSLPGSLRAVAYLEILFGIGALIEIASSLFEGRLSFNFAVAGLWIGLGLLRRRESSRKWGFRLAILSAIVSSIASPLLFLGADRLPVMVFGRPHGDISHWWPFGFLMLVAVISAWEAWVLQRRDIRAHFAQDSSVASASAAHPAG